MNTCVLSIRIPQNTYTYESPHTCVNLLWQSSESMSNAFNFKDRDDWVTTFPAWWGSTTYGKDKDFVIGELKREVFISTFPNIEILQVLIIMTEDMIWFIYFNME